MRGPALTGGALLLAAAGPLAGCSSTMQTAARLQLNDARIRATSQSVRVPRTAARTTVRVQRMAVVKARGRTAYAVTIRNAGAAAVSNLPISIGYTTARRAAVYLNARANLPYFDAHLPGIAANREITWVFAAARALPAGARPFAAIGASPNPPTGHLSVPAISASVRSLRLVRHGVAVTLHNLSGIPQYQLPVYAFAQRGGRLVAAGTTSVTTLGGSADETVHLRLLGDSEGIRLTVEAPATIFN